MRAPALATLGRMLSPAITALAALAALGTWGASPAAAPTRIAEAEPVAGPEAGARVCFPADSWSAPDHERPCYRIRGPYEDGSGTLVIRADTIRARCAIPNIHEEPARFTLPCVARGG